jgi:O-antigen ligase
MRLLHDEYLQVLLELGVVGGLLLLGFGIACVHAARTGRPTLGTSGGPESRSRWTAAVTASVVLAVSSLVDFVWHVPAVALTGAVAAADTHVSGCRDDHGRTTCGEDTVSRTVSLG